MKARSKRKVEACKRSVRHVADHPLDTPNARLTALVASLNTMLTAFRTYTADQSGGELGFHSGTITRRQMAKLLRDDMRAVNRMAKGLPKADFPGVRELFLMPRSGSYEALIARANAFLEKVGPIKAVFVERGLPADFDEQLAERLAAVDTASDTRDSARSERVGGTAGLDAKANEALAIVREMDPILSYQYRNDPALLASWKSACHVDRDPSRAEDDEEEAGSGGGAPLALASTSRSTSTEVYGEEPIALEPRHVNGTAAAGQVV
jgi:hypothetical protein